MDFTKLIQYLNSLYDTFRKDWKFFNDSQIDAIKENTQAIENKEVIEEVSVKNPTDIEPLVEAQNATTEAIKSIPRVEIPKTDFSSLEDKILALKYCLEKKEMSVNIGKTIVDTQGIIKAIEKLPKLMPKMEEKEMTDYTLMLDGIMKLLERPKDHSEIKKLQELVKKLGTTDDLIAIAEWLKIIALKEYPEPKELPVKDGRVLVSVDRVGGGGGGGLTKIETDALVNLEGKDFATESKQLPDNHQVTVSNIASTPVITGFATESNQITELARVGKIYDTVSGEYKGLLFHSEAPQVCSQDYLLSMAEGDITGHTSFTKYGKVAGVNNLLVDVWAGEGGTASKYVFPPSAIQFNVVSSSTSDDLGSTGIEKIMISGLDANYAEQTEEITMDGTTPVTTSKSFIRINGCYATQAGSAGVAVGTITVKNTANTITYSAINIGLTACRSLIYTVPAGKTLYLTSITVASGAGGNAIKLNAVTFTPKYRLFGSTVFLPAGEFLSINVETIRPLEVPAKFPEKTDIKMSVQGDYDSGGTTCIGAVRGWIE